MKTGNRPRCFFCPRQTNNKGRICVRCLNGGKTKEDIEATKEMTKKMKAMAKLQN